MFKVKWSNFDLILISLSFSVWVLLLLGHNLKMLFSFLVFQVIGFFFVIGRLQYTIEREKDHNGVKHDSN